MLQNYIILVILYLVIAVINNQSYKLLIKNIQNAGAATVIADGISGIISLLLIPLFGMKLSENKLVYLFLTLACIFYALSDRLSNEARKGIEASTFGMIKQLSTVLMIFAGLIFFKEKFIITKFVGAIIIILSNILVFYKKGALKNDKYVWIGLLASMCSAIALFIDVSYSGQFNLPIYCAFTIGVPSILIFIFERISIKELKEELNKSNKKIVLTVCITNVLSILIKLSAYELGKVTIVAPLCSLTIILNVIVGYIFLKEKKDLLKKFIAATLIVLGIILIKL